MIVVSGASTGIGAATARALAARGHHVLAGVRTDREAGAIRAEGVEPVIFDVTEPGHIAVLAAPTTRSSAPPRHGRQRRHRDHAPVEVLRLISLRLGAAAAVVPSI